VGNSSSAGSFSLQTFNNLIRSCIIDEWDLAKTARLLKIHVSQVKRKIRSYGLHKGDEG